MILEKHTQTLNALRAVSDPLCVLLAWCLSYALRFQSGLFPLPLGGDTFARYFQLAPALLLSYVLVFWLMGLYRSGIDRKKPWDEHFDILRGHAVAFLVFVTLTYFLFEHRFSRLAMLLFVGIAPFVLAVGRSVVRKYNRLVIVPRKPLYRAILVGDGPLAARAEQTILARPDWHLACVGKAKVSEAEKVRSLVERDAVDVVIVAVAPAEMEQVSAFLGALGNTLAELLFLPDFGIPHFLAPRVSRFDDVPVIGLNASRLSGFGAVFKRAYDIAFSTAFLICAAPVFFACALAVKLTSKGPVFYRQERMGLDGKTFQCIKFRGMRVDAEHSSGPVWAQASDPRVTPVGRWLRRTSLDEIPQFINVLRGEMSVVGPRPERPVFVTQFRGEIPGYMLRHKVKAGLTGWAQVNGWRGNTSLEKRIEHDLWYIQNWSLWLDLKICLLTPFKGFIHPNAY